MEQTCYEEQVKYINEIRSIKHDMQAHMVILQYYLETENYEKAKTYLEDMKGHQNFEKWIFIDTGNDLVNAILNDTLSQSSKKILFSHDGMLPENLRMEEYEVCTLFSNLFSNAKEACERLEHSEPVIYMEVKSEGDFYFIKIQNPIEWEIDVKNLGNITSKENQKEHGYGLKNIIEVVERYNGEIDFVVMDQIFCVEIALIL